MIAWFGSDARAQERVPCIPYHHAIERLAAAGAIILDPVIFDGFTVDSLMIVDIRGAIIASRVIDGCVIAEDIHLGVRVAPKGIPS